MTALFKKDLTLKMSIDNRIINNVDVKLEELPNHKCKFVIKLDSEVEIVKDNFFECLSLFKLNYLNVILFCKGYKLNVYPSRMCLQMGMGLKAYEMHLGKQSTFNNLVDIFDYEEHNLVNSLDLQREYYLKWISSLTSSH